MPIYVYECKQCEETFEIEQRISEDSLTDCPSCHEKGTLRRLIQPAGIMFRGEGFHINDYAGPKPSAPTPEPPSPPSTSAET